MWLMLIKYINILKNEINRYLATAASNRELKIWDVRKLEGPVQEYKLITAANNLNFSQKNMLALGMGNVVEIYRFVFCCVKKEK
jgi:U3 small nucleolar RNA-associated protein 7